LKSTEVDNKKLAQIAQEVKNIVKHQAEQYHTKEGFLKEQCENYQQDSHYKEKKLREAEVKWMEQQSELIDKSQLVKELERKVN